MVKKKKESETCPICGGAIWKGQKVLIEGAKMTVCQNCAQYGKKVATKPKNLSKGSPLPPKSYPKKKIPYLREMEGSSIEVVSDYAQKIRDARIKKQLTQEVFAQKIHEKLSLVRRIEAEKMKPTMKLAKKIEEILDIKLTNEVQENAVDYKSYLKKSKGRSLGDLAFIKKKK